MTNPTTPYGFKENGIVEGGEPTFGVYTGSLGASYAVSVYQGDPALLASGLLTLATVTGTTGAGVVGVFESFNWLSKSAGMRIYQRYWPGIIGDLVAGSTVNAVIKINPAMIMQARVTGASNNPVTQAMVGQAINFAVGAGPGANGISSYSIDGASLQSTSATLPFLIYGLVQQPECDPTLVNNEVFVRFNPASFVYI